MAIKRELTEETGIESGNVKLFQRKMLLEINVAVELTITDGIFMLLKLKALIVLK